MDGFLAATWLSLLVIFVAELGDKSQLMALAFSTKYKALPVLIGITLATALVHAASVGIGVGLGTALPTREISVVAGLAFIGFGIWTFRGDKLDENDQKRVEKRARNAIVAASVAFFLAELGDKTMLATITLATRDNPWGVWLGSTIGMVLADALAIIVGKTLGKHLPEKAIRYGATAAFLIFGVVLLIEAIAQY